MEADAQVEIKKQRILIVDDSKTMRRAMRRLLVQDFDVIEAEDGKEAWKRIAEDQDIQAVFSDLVMPRMNGFELLRQIRESIHSRINQLPVVIITGHNDDERMHRQAMMLGATDFITKPFDAMQLKARARASVKFDETTRKLDDARHIIETQSTIDPLTRLANKLYFKQHGSELISFALRHDKPLSILRMSVDKYDVLFKKKGREIAEKILVNVARIIANSVRQEDTVARIGLAQFGVLMPGADELTARKIANRIHQLMQKTGYRIGNTRFRMTMSAGLVSPTLSADLDFDEMLKVAETRLNKAMASGGNKLIFEEPAAAGGITSDHLRPKNLLSVEEALVLLKSGETTKLAEQTHLLVDKIYPLLQFANHELRLGIDGSLMMLRERIDHIMRERIVSGRH
ncbi:MAG TPA: response regulator [Thioalkalivibrio sp.]|nr:response regulator [Thioalkalivibrio sp.]